jgi:hypothetical protein
MSVVVMDSEPQLPSMENFLPGIVVGVVITFIAIVMLQYPSPFSDLIKIYVYHK